MTKARRLEKPRPWDALLTNTRTRNREILRRYAAGATQADLAREYKLSPQRVSVIVRRAQTSR